MSALAAEIESDAAGLAAGLHVHSTGSSAAAAPPHYSAHDVLSFRAHYDAAGLSAARSRTDPLLTLALAEPARAGAASPAPPCLATVRRVLDQLRGATHVEAASCRAGAAAAAAATAALGALSVPRPPPPRPAAPDAAAVGSPLQARHVHSRPHYSERTAELLGAIAAFRAGLQHAEQRRRRANDALRRDPSATDAITADRALPRGFVSPYPL